VVIHQTLRYSMVLEDANIEVQEDTQNALSQHALSIVQIVWIRRRSRFNVETFDFIICTVTRKQCSNRCRTFVERE